MCYVNNATKNDYLVSRGSGSIEPDCLPNSQPEPGRRRKALTGWVNVPQVPKPDNENLFKSLLKECILS